MKKITFFTFLLSFIVFAQPGGRMHRPMERIENFKKIKMIETLNLNEETGIKLVSRYNKHREKMQDFEQERVALVDKLEQQVQSNVSDAEFQKTFNELLELERKMMDSRKKYLEELKDIFNNKQIAQYLIFERNFARDLRNVAKDLQKERMRKD